MDAIRPEIDMDRYKMFHTENAPDIDEEKDPPARFCSADCRLSYREERMSGMPLPTHIIDGQRISHKMMCAQKNLCASCQSKLDM